MKGQLDDHALATLMQAAQGGNTQAYVLLLKEITPRGEGLFRHVRARVSWGFTAHQHVEVCFNDDRFTLHKNWTRML